MGYEKVDFPNVQHSSGNLFKRALERSATKSMPNKLNRPWRKLGSDDVSQVAIVCGMYHAALNTLSQLKLDILSGMFARTLY